MLRKFTNHQTLCLGEIVPKNGDYLNPDKWVTKFDAPRPVWWKKSNTAMLGVAFEKWKNAVRSKIKLKEARHPTDPSVIEPPEKITDAHIRLLKEWASIRCVVGTSTGRSVTELVGASIRRSVGNSVWTSVERAVVNSVGASAERAIKRHIHPARWYVVDDIVDRSLCDVVYAYVGSLFLLDQEAWGCTGKIKTKGYPFESAVKLWKMGLIPTFGGNRWRLYSAKHGKMFEISHAEALS